MNKVEPIDSFGEKSVEMIEIAADQLGSGQYTMLDENGNTNSGGGRMNFGGGRVNDIGAEVDFSPHGQLYQSN